MRARQQALADQLTFDREIGEAVKLLPAR